MANTFNDTTIRDDKKLAVGTSEDFNLKHNSGAGYTEVSSIGNIFARIISKVIRWLDNEWIEFGTDGDIRATFKTATSSFELQDAAGAALFGVHATAGIVTVPENLAVAGRIVRAATDYTISGGAITVTNDNVRVDTEGAASADDLDTINGGADGQIIMVYLADAAHNVTLVAGGNLALTKECVLDAVEDRIFLSYDDATATWNEVCRSVRGVWGFGDAVDYTIATGAITVTNSNVCVDTEAAAATDDLDTINGGADGNVIIVSAKNSSRDVVLKDGTGNLSLAGDCTLSDTSSQIVLKYQGSTWHEISRSQNLSAIASGTWTPTITGVSNVSASTARVCHYERNGSTVSFGGSVAVTHTDGATFTEVAISIPIASNLGSSYHLSGGCGCVLSEVINIKGIAKADTVNDRITITYVSDAADATEREITFYGSYRVV